MYFDVFKQLINNVKAKTGNIKNYEFHLHKSMANRLKKEIEELSNTSIGMEAGELFGFPVVINNTVPPDKIYFIDGGTLKRIKENMNEEGNEEILQSIGY